MGLVGKKKADTARAPNADQDPLARASEMSISTLNIRASMLQLTKPKEETPKPKVNREKPKLDLADADLLGITVVAEPVPEPEEELLLLPPSPDKSGKIDPENAAKVAKIIQEHLVHKQAVATYNLLRSFRPVQLLLLSCGLFPVQFIKNEDGTWSFESSLKKPSGICFIISAFLITFTFLVGFSNLVVIQVYDQKNNRSGLYCEKKLGRILLDRHIMIFVIIGLALVESFVAVLVMLYRRNRFADHFADWSEKLLLIQMDMTSGTFLSAVVICVTFVCIIIIIFIMSVSFSSPSSVGGPLVLGMVTLRNMLPVDWVLLSTHRGLVHAWGLILTILILISSKAPLLFFVHKCKLLKNGFALWNARLYNATLQSDDIQQTKEGRTTYGILYEDYFHLLKLKEDMDKLFAGIVETFFCLQSISVTCELYLGIRSMKYGHFQDDAAADGNYYIRPYDWVPGMLLCIVSIMFLHSVSMNAIELGEEISSGLEIIRRSTMLGKKKEEELFFMASLFTNYTEYNYGTNNLEGIGLFYFDRETHGTLIGLTCALFMIIYQFQPIMEYNLFRNGDIPREDVGRFLHITDGLPEGHWL